MSPKFKCSVCPGVLSASPAPLSRACGLSQPLRESSALEAGVGGLSFSKPPLTEPSVKDTQPGVGGEGVECRAGAKTLVR